MRAALARHGIATRIFDTSFEPVSSGPVLLILPADGSVPAAVEAIRCLQSTNIPYGILPWTSDEAGTRWAAKIFDAAPIVVRADRIARSSGNLPEACGPNKVAHLQTAPGDDALRADALFISGHSNQLDGHFGPQLLLCGTALDRRQSPRAYPCRQTGVCFRASGEKLGARALPQTLSAKFLFITGCNMVPLGAAWYDPELSLLDGLSRSPAELVVASMGLVSSGAADDDLMISLLSAGVTIFDAVRAANSKHNDVRAHFGIPKDMSPLVVIGNPLTTVEVVPRPAAARRAVRRTTPSAPVTEDRSLAQTTRNGRDAGGPQCATSTLTDEEGNAAFATGLDHEATSAVVWLDALGTLHRVNKKVSPFAERLEVLALELIDQASGWADPRKQKASRSAQAIEAVQLTAEILSLHSTRILSEWIPGWEVLVVDQGGAEHCLCGSPLIESILRHPLLPVKRMLASCPSCGPVIDHAHGPDGDLDCTAIPAAPILVTTDAREIVWRRQTVSAPLPACGLIQDVYYSVDKSRSPVVSNVSECGDVRLMVPDHLGNGSYPVAVVSWGEAGFSIRRDMLDLQNLG